MAILKVNLLVIMRCHPRSVVIRGLQQHSPVGEVVNRYLGYIVQIHLCTSTRSGTLVRRMTTIFKEVKNLSIRRKKQKGNCRMSSLLVPDNYRHQSWTGTCQREMSPDIWLTW